MSDSPVRPMDGWEYQAFYDYGLMPERFWPSEIEKLKAQYLADEISLADFERELEGLLDVRGLEEIWGDTMSPERALTVDDDAECAGIGSRMAGVASAPVAHERLICPTDASPDQLRSAPAEDSLRDSQSARSRIPEGRN